jgi:hypothetical protein
MLRIKDAPGSAGPSYCEDSHQSGFFQLFGVAERATVLRLPTRGQPLGVESHAGENRILDNGYEKRASPRETAQGCVLNGYPCRHENVAFRINVLRTVRAWGYQFN